MSGEEALPSTWASVRLAELGNWVGGGTPSKANPAYWTNGTIPWISPKDMKAEQIHSSEDRITAEAVASSATNLLPKGSVLVVTRSGILKHSLPVAVTQIECAINQDLKALVPFEGIDPTYIAYALRAFEASILADTAKGGTTVQSIELASFLRSEVPIAPLPEQRRIVGEIEKELTRLDAAVTLLQKVQANLRRYRAATLKAACDGRLVPTEANLALAEGRGYEQADQLIKRIQRRPTTNSSGLPPLAKGWSWATIGDLFYVSVGATPSRQRPDFWGGRIPWISSGEVAFSRIRQTKERITETGLKNTSTECHPRGTVLLAMIGEGKTRGQAALLDVEACNSQNSAAIRVSETEFEPEYVYYFFWSEYESTRRLGSGNNQSALNKSRVQEIRIPVPPRAEQRRIVQELERQLSVLDDLQNYIKNNLKKARSLRRGVLRKAFEGRLVFQDPNDEPASALLERIREAKASKQTEPRAKRKKDAPAALPTPPPLPAPVAKPAPPTTAEPAPEALELDFLDFPRDEQMEVVWETLFGHGTLEKDEAIRTAAEGLRNQGFAQFKRLRQDGPLYRDIATAIEKGVREGWFDRPRRGSVRAVLRDPKEYAAEDWQRCLLAVVGTEPADIDTTLRAAAEWGRETLGLEYARLREDGAVLTGLREALEELVRAKRMVRKRGRIQKALA